MSRQTTLGIIIPETGISEKKLIDSQILDSTFTYKVMRTNNIKQAIRKIGTRYVVIFEADSKVSYGYLTDAISNMWSPNRNSIPAAMSAATAFDEYKIFGYEVDDDDILPSLFPRSKYVYHNPAIYIPGSIIKRKYLIDSKLNFKNMVRDSMKLSMFLWSMNKGIKLDPNHCYFSPVDCGEITLGISKMGYNMDRVKKYLREEGLL